MKTFASRRSEISATLLKAGDARLAELRSVAASALDKAVSGVMFTAAKAEMITPNEGKVAMVVSGFMNHLPVRFRLEASIAKGTSDLADSEASRAKILAAAQEALKASEATRPVISRSADPSFVVDLKAIRAFRAADKVVFTSGQLSNWGLRLEATSLSTPEGRESAIREVVDSLGSHVVTQIGLQADFGKDPFTLPVVASVAVKKQIQAAPIDWLTSQAMAQEADQLAIRASLASEAAQKGAKTVNDPRPDQKVIARRRLDAQVKLETEVVAFDFARHVLKASNPAIVSMDFTGVKEDASGRKSGDAIYALRFPGRFRMEEASIKVPYGADGRPDPSNTGRTKADVLAQKRKADDLKILSEQERAEQMRRFKADKEKTEKMLTELGLDVYAGGSAYTTNFQKQGAPDMIPIRKTMVPDEFSKPDVKLLVDGMLYVVEETDWQAPSIEASTHWMLRLVPGGTAKQADHRLVYASVLGDLLAGGAK